MATVLFAIVVAGLTAVAGWRLLILRYAPSPMARQIRSLQAGLALRMLRDRILYLRSRDLRMLYGYRKCIRELQVAVLLRNGFEAHASKLGPEIERLARQTEEYAMIDRYYARKLQQAVVFWGAMSDAQLNGIAKAIRDELMEGLVPISTVANYLKEERQTIKQSPHMAVGHYGRMLSRMREIRKAVLAAGGGGLAKRR